MWLAMGRHSIISVCFGFMVGEIRTQTMNELPKTLSQTVSSAEGSLRLSAHYFLLGCCYAHGELRWRPQPQ